MKAHIRTLLLAAILVMAALIPTTHASASKTQPTMLQDDPELIYGSSDLRTKRLDQLKNLGVDIVKVRVRWRDLAPRKPSNGADPNAYDWGPYDEIVSGAESRGMGVY